MTNKTRIKQAKKALKKATPEDVIIWDDGDPDTVTVNGKTIPRAEADRLYPGPHKVIGLGIDLGEI